VSKSARMLIAAAFSAISVVPTFAQQKPTEPTPDRVKALIAQAQQNIAQNPAQPTSLPPQPEGPVVNLSEQDAVNMARDKNLTLAAERITPETFDFTIAATRAVYLPNLTSNVQSVNQTNLNSNVFSGGVQTKNETRSWSAGLTKRMWWGGGNYSVSWTNNRTETNSTSQNCNPCFSSGLDSIFTQPLWRNFKIDATRAQVLTNDINQSIADINLSGQVVSILAQVRNAYWELAYARASVDAARRSLELASRLVLDNRSRVEIGSMAPIEIVQAQAEEATRRQQLVNAEATLRNNELALKRLIVSGTEDTLWKATIVPSDQPTVTAQPIDLEGAVRNALSQRTDLAVTKKNLEATDVNLRSLYNDMKPDLNAVGRLNLSGRGGLFLPVRDPITGITTVPPAGNYFGALGNISSFEAPTWDFRLQFAYPLGKSAQEANYARQQLLKKQTETTMKATELQIATEVTAAALAVRNSFEAMQASQVSRQLSQQRLEAAEAKFQQGMATNFEVVQAQRDLNDARNSELRQMLNYQRALVDFQRVQITR